MSASSEPASQPETALPPGQQLVAPGKWPAIGERRPLLEERPWSVRVEGCVEAPQEFSLDQLRQLTVLQQSVDIHCVTRWSKLGAVFTGVALAELLSLVQVRPEARYISFLARSQRGHSTSLLLEDALKLGALLVWEVDGEPLAEIHGGPLRTVVPGRYFYKSLKWLERIELLKEDRLGYWEATAGYHNVADPWQQQRYVAPTLSKQQAAQLIQSRDCAGQNLTSLVAAGHDLTGLNAQGAILRNANFSRCRLESARFQQANLSNANLQQADLRLAQFGGADVEGADFGGANLCGADFRGASLFGATFVTHHPVDGLLRARLDSQTKIDPQALQQLTPPQVEYLLQVPGLSL